MDKNGTFTSIEEKDNNIENLEKNQEISRLIGLLGSRVNSLLGIKQIIFSGGQQVGFVKNVGNGLVQYIAKNGEKLRIKGKNKFDMIQINSVDSETGKALSGKISINGSSFTFDLINGEYEIDGLVNYIPYYNAKGVKFDKSYQSNLKGEIIHEEIDFSVDNIHIEGLYINVGNVINDVIKKLREKNIAKLTREEIRNSFKIVK